MTARRSRSHPTFRPTVRSGRCRRPSGCRWGRPSSTTRFRSGWRVASRKAASASWSPLPRERDEASEAIARSPTGTCSRRTPFPRPRSSVAGERSPITWRSGSARAPSTGSTSRPRSCRRSSVRSPSLVVPELQRRGLFRTEYEGATLREHLGLARPENLHVAEAPDRRPERVSLATAAHPLRRAVTHLLRGGCGAGAAQAFRPLRRRAMPRASVPMKRIAPMIPSQKSPSNEKPTTVIPPRRPEG